MTLPFPRGAEWRKWDLHVHSPMSILSNQFPAGTDGKPDWEAYISKLESTDLSVVGITDYFTIDGYKKVREFKANGRLKNIQTVLPNVEFRLSSVIASRKDGDKPRRLNFHVVFSDELAPQDIEEHFLHDLHFHYEASPQSSDESRKLKVSNIEALGKKLISENKDFRESGAPPLMIGAKTTVVNHEQITEILAKDSRFKDKYFIIFPEELSNLIEWGGQDHVIRQVLLQKSDMVFSSNSRTNKWCLGVTPYEEGPNAFAKEFKSLKPCIHGSDAHKLDEVANPCAKRGDPNHKCSSQPEECELRFCWIKADPTFEGLRQLKYEPTDRVRIQSADPTPLKSNACVKALWVSGARVDEELSLDEVNVPLNESLVAVTGGKGAGKTAFVDILSNHFKDRCNTKDTNSFVRRIAQDGADFNTAITFEDETLFEKALSDPKFVDRSNIVYIAQGELEEYIGENSDLDEYIRDLIFESPEIKNTVKAFEFEKLSTELEQHQSAISTRNRNIRILEERTADSVLISARRDRLQIESELKDVEAKIPALQSRLTEEKIEVVHREQDRRSTLQGRKSQLVELNSLISSVREFYLNDLSRHNLDISRINDLLKELKIVGTLPTLVYEDAARFQEIADGVEIELSAVVKDIEDLEKKIQGYAQEMQEHARYLSRRDELAAKFVKSTKALEEIAADAKKLDDNRADRVALFAKLLRTVLTQQQKYGEIIELFGVQKAEVLSDLDFKAKIHFASAQLLEGLREVLDNRVVQVIGDETAPSQFASLQDYYRQACDGDESAVRKITDETSRLVAEMRGKVKTSQAINVEHLYKCLFGTFLTVLPIVTYKKTALSRLSLGQKATVLIKIYLAQGTSPIIIDSHDDHLDNEFIMEELVGAIRKAKTYRQVILASNNGNVVVNSDAEQIVIADRKDGRISYISGSIENPDIRDRALRVLEGGAQAFKKRQEKYGIEG